MGLTQSSGKNSDWFVTITQSCGKALIGWSQIWGQNFRPIRALPQIWVIVTDQSEFFPQLWAIWSENYLALFNFEALFQRVVGHLSEKLLQWNNIHIRRRAYLPYPARLKPQKWLYLANTFLAPPPRGVAALVSVSDDKIQTTLLILRRGALSRLTCHS